MAKTVVFALLEDTKLISRKSQRYKNLEIFTVCNLYFSEKVSRHDMGTYTCIAKNNVPPTVSKNFKLTVNFVPQIEVTNQVVGAPVGTNIILRCNIQASPKPMTFWSKKSGK